MRCGIVFDYVKKKTHLQNLEKTLSQPNIWDNQEHAQKIVSEIKSTKWIVESLDSLFQKIDDISVLYELAIEENDSSTLKEVKAELIELEKDISKLELQSLLNNEYDKLNCFFSIQAGAGGTESCDWSEMLLRMYTRYFQRAGYEAEEISLKPGEEAGIQSVTLLVKGPYAYGYLSCEMGVHRLVRISPFDSSHRRHTSFAAVDVVPEFPDDIEINIRDEDLKIDFFRAGGAGGQHVNKVSSAVRITHIPTGIVVTCQNERSQHQNRRIAMSILKGKLFRLEQQKRDEELAKIVGEKGEIAWGNQIRSYILHPYQLVKDHRTGIQTSNTQAVLDGQLDEFIEAYLRLRVKKENR